MADTICRFVDSIAAAPVLRFDFNSNASATMAECDLQREGTEFPMPPLLRSVSVNAMRDGGSVSSSQYGMRSVRLRAFVKDASPDKVGTSLQTLWRELDRVDNFLMWQPKGMSKPVFFRTFRSSAESVSVQFSTALGVWVVQLDLLAEPFALGLRETLGPFTVNNDPAAGSNGLFFDVTGVIGDVASPPVIVDTAAYQPFIVLGVRQHGTPSDLTFFAQAESLTLGTDTTNPGGGPDAAMSGTGTNNFVRTSFATSIELTRLSWTPTGGATSVAAGQALRGTYRLWAVVRRSDVTSVITIGAHASTLTLLSSERVVLPPSLVRIPVDLGLISFDSGGERPGGMAPVTPVLSKTIEFRAERTGGSDTLDWDFVMLIPADEATMIARHNDVPSSRDTSRDGYYDCGVGEVGAIASGGNLFDGTAVVSPPPVDLGFSVAGGFPSLVPNQTNRFYLLTGEIQSGNSGPSTTKTHTETLSVSYWPRYLYVRPSAS